ncbi:insulin-like growth factor-binding protein 4 [Protopterus annectens]|uniref:insulin-like growth factor-binding protein 4 n=1 Tax=Protopterus annectens TaxID=7888 RepID=UPI001CFB63EB|nr:insulin-like growth factor-binding protein 4 [Protopterus annectens]
MFFVLDLRMSVNAFFIILFIALMGLCIMEEAIQCPHCTDEKIARCKQPVGCEELVREPGCGCCSSCALGKGMLCGVYTARCGSGLRCYPQKGVDKPLHKLIQGQGVCMEPSEIELIQSQQDPTMNIDHPNNSHYSPCHPPQDKKCQKYTVIIREKLHTAGRAQNNRVTVEEPKVLGSCLKELQVALEKLASQSRTHEDFYTIPIPNCDRSGNFHVKQCHPALDGQRGKCWCVDTQTGRKLDKSPEVKGDLDCELLLTENKRE